MDGRRSENSAPTVIDFSSTVLKEFIFACSHLAERRKGDVETKGLNPLFSFEAAALGMGILFPLTLL